MKEKIYVIKNQDSFELEDIFECGQCFRWNKKMMIVIQEYLVIVLQM